MVNSSLQPYFTIFTPMTSAPLKTLEGQEIKDLYKVEKIGSLVFGSILVTIGTYLVATLSWYEYQVLKKNRKEGKVCKQRGQLMRDRTGDWLRWLCMVASILALVRYILEVVETVLGQTSATICNPIRRTKEVVTCCILTCIYFTLWLRQRSVYKAPAMMHLINKTIQFFSKSVLIIMATANVLTIALFLSTRGYQNSPAGCRLLWNSVWKKLPGLLHFIFTIIFQITLLGLLIYPLHKHTVAMKVVSSCSQKKEIALVKRVVIAALIAVLSDGIAGLVTLLAHLSPYETINELFYDVDLLINIFAVLYSFNDWKIRICPCFAKEKNVIGTVKRRNNEINRTGVSSVCDDV